MLLMTGFTAVNKALIGSWETLLQREDNGRDGGAILHECVKLSANPTLSLDQVILLEPCYNTLTATETALLQLCGLRAPRALSVHSGLPKKPCQNTV